MVRLDDGRTVRADDAYLTRSIDDPDAEIVAGYQRGVMSSVIRPGQIDPADTRALVAYIDSLR
jgi:cytochrome c oxidase subunit 2